ncbi:MAG: type II toxin-antitoxin system prevent-host-death family antitoxin [Pseudomonadota bacterium]
MSAPDSKAGYNIHEAKTNFSKLVSRAEDGAVTIVSRYGKPVACIAPIELVRMPRKKGLSFGALRGPMNMSWEEFEALNKELDEEILKDFEDSIAEISF